MLADSLWSQLDTDQIRFIQPSRVDEMKQSLGIRDISESLNKEQVGKIAKYLGSDVLDDRLVSGERIIESTNGGLEHPSDSDSGRRKHRFGSEDWH